MAAAKNEAPTVAGRVPRHVAVIMDGNGRWAKARGLPRLSGHRAGTEALRRTIEACIQFKVEILTIYAFSTENWKRPAYEVRGLMYLLEEVIDRQLDELDEAGIQIRHVGWLDGIPDHLAAAIAGAVERTAGNSRLILNVAFNYGSRAEIVRAVRSIIRSGATADEVDEAMIARHLETSDLRDPDLIIRTSGEMRLSNFLLWQAAYSEIYCTPVLWPDFGADDLRLALESYSRRERRFGLVPDAADDDRPRGAQTATDAAPAVAEGAPAAANRGGSPT